MPVTGQAMIDSAGILVGVDAGFCDLVRYAPDALVSRSILEITAPADRAECEAALSEMVRTRRQVFATKRYLCGDGTVVWAKATASLVLRADFPGFAILHATPIVGRRSTSHPASLLECARLVRGFDAARSTVIEPNLLPAWNAIVAAYVAEAEGRLFPGEEMDLFGFASYSSFSRWTAALVEQGVFEVETRNPDPHSAKSYRLTAATHARLERYLREVLSTSVALQSA